MDRRRRSRACQRQWRKCSAAPLSAVSACLGGIKQDDALLMARGVKACPVLFTKQETLYPETRDFVAENGNKIA